MTENLENESDEWVPPKMTWVLQEVPDKRVVEGEDKTATIPEDTFNWNHTTAALVTVARPPQKMRRLQVKQPQLDATDPAMPASGPEVRDDDGAAGSDADVLPPDAGVEDAEMAPPHPLKETKCGARPKACMEPAAHQPTQCCHCRPRQAQNQRRRQRQKAQLNRKQKRSLLQRLRSPRPKRRSRLRPKLKLSLAHLAGATSVSCQCHQTLHLFWAAADVGTVAWGVEIAGPRQAWCSTAT